MNIALSAILVFFLCMLAILSLGEKFHFLKRSYYIGIELWSRWLPVLGTSLYIAILGANVVGGRNPLLRYFDLAGGLTFPELVVLFLIGPLFFSGAGSLLSAATVVYLAERLLIEGHVTVTAAWLVLISSATTTAILADKMPWVRNNGETTISALVREVLVLVIAFAALAAIFSTFLKLQSFTVWSDRNLSLPLHSNVTLLTLGLLGAGWTTIAVGMTRHFTLPMVCLPTVVIAAFVTHWPSYILVIPLTVCMTLSLAVADRRRTSRR